PQLPHAHELHFARERVQHLAQQDVRSICPAEPLTAASEAISATLMKAETATDGPPWVFQDVHPGGHMEPEQLHGPRRLTELAPLEGGLRPDVRGRQGP